MNKTTAGGQDVEVRLKNEAFAESADSGGSGGAGEADGQVSATGEVKARGASLQPERAQACSPSRQRQFTDHAGSFLPKRGRPRRPLPASGQGFPSQSAPEKVNPGIPEQCIPLPRNHRGRFHSAVRQRTVEHWRPRPTAPGASRPKSTTTSGSVRPEASSRQTCPPAALTDTVPATPVPDAAGHGGREQAGGKKLSANGAPPGRPTAETSIFHGPCHWSENPWSA